MAATNSIRVVNSQLDTRLQNQIYYWKVPFSVLGNKVRVIFKYLKATLSIKTFI